MIDPRLARRWLNSCRWMQAYMECLDQHRPVSVVRTEWQVRGWLL